MKKGVTLALSLFTAGTVFALQLRRGLVPNAQPAAVVFAALLSALLALAVLWGALALWERLRR